VLPPTKEGDVASAAVLASNQQVVAPTFRARLAASLSLRCPLVRRHW
jgi:hypothetical protein